MKIKFKKQGRRVSDTHIHPIDKSIYKISSNNYTTWDNGANGAGTMCENYFSILNKNANKCKNKKH